MTVDLAGSRMEWERMAGGNRAVWGGLSELILAGVGFG